MPTPPAVVTPGNLYVDLASRTLWLGVDVSEDPAGSVLISDIIDTEASIVAAIATAEGYTDAQVATRAPLAHTHLHGDITDFTAAVLAVIAGSPSTGIPIGLIAMYSGSLANIGVGDYANWALCDGAGGRPDLRDKFVVGAGNVATGTVSPQTPAATNAAGGHTPVIQATTLTLAQVPAHTHSASLSGSGTGATSTDGNHGHPLNLVVGGAGGGTAVAVGIAVANENPSARGSAAAAGDHNHSVTVSVSVSGSTGSQGSGGSHTHGANAVPDHSHTTSSANLKNALPWYAVAFIIKVS